MDSNVQHNHDGGDHDGCDHNVRSDLDRRPGDRRRSDRRRSDRRRDERRDAGPPLGPGPNGAFAVPPVARSPAERGGGPPGGRIPSGERQCGWCCNTFSVERRPGRPRIYCRRSCRQRAHERRKGLGVLPPPDRLIMTPQDGVAPTPINAPGYEAGKLVPGGKEHAMRPASVTDAEGRRLTLCGLLARPIPRRFSPAFADDACQTCAAVEVLRPSARRVRPSTDLSELRCVLDQAAVEVCRPPGSAHPRRSFQRILGDLLDAA